MDAYPSVVGSLGGGGPVEWPRMNLEMHLHLNSDLASNEFLTEFPFKIRTIPSGFALVRHSREQATVGTCKYERVRVRIAPAPLILKWLHPAPPPPPPTYTAPRPRPPLPQSSRVVQSAAMFAEMKSENPRSVLLSSVYNVL